MNLPGLPLPSAPGQSLPAADELHRLFAGDTYRFQFGIRRGTQDWFGLGGAPGVLDQRRRLLAMEGNPCIAWTPCAGKLFAEFRSWFTNLPPALSRLPADAGGAIALASEWEPDFLLLQRDGLEFRLAGGCVCFPSSWRLSEKIGRTVTEIHEPVPTLNHELGEHIRTFLGRLAPGELFERENWGLAATPELNLHPDLEFSRLGPATPLEEIWLRIEYQAFRALPATSALAFLIRVRTCRLAEVLTVPEVAPAFRRMIETMPAEIARYKGIAPVRMELSRRLAAGG